MNLIIRTIQKRLIAHFLAANDSKSPQFYSEISVKKPKVENTINSQHTHLFKFEKTKTEIKIK